MSRHFFTAAYLMLCLMCAACEDTDLGTATEAGIDAVRAVTLDDEDVGRLSRELAGQLDRKNTAAPPQNPYARRLQRLVQGHEREQGYEFNFKVYLSPQVNAFALADGSIRIYSGLMDIMTDEELLFVVGHEMGHVVEQHAKNKIRLAYAGSAVRKAVAAQRNEAGVIAGSVLGALAETLLNAQYSQQEERNADDYGVRFILRQGHGVEPAVSALTKLATQGGEHSFLSSHPAPRARAERLQDAASSPQPSPKPTFWKRMADWLKDLWPLGKDVQET